MDDLSPAFAAESLTVNIIEELRERLESTDDYTKQLSLITEMEEKYNLEEGILLSQKDRRSLGISSRMQQQHSTCTPILGEFLSIGIEN
jgi:hypothetical protein